MKRSVRTIFYLHLFVTAYCIMCGLLDMSGHFHRWLIPNAAIGFLLIASAFAFPIAAGVAVVGSGCKHPVILVFTHIAMGAAQLFIGLLPLIS